MIDHINFSDIFTSSSHEYLKKYKQSNGMITKHTLQNRYIELMNFINNSSYWSRFNANACTGKWNTNSISGKYLNEIHIYNVKYEYYRTLYMNVLKKYLELTNYESLSDISIDSCFIRNIQCTSLSRNPAYNNKPGHKIHALVDSNRVAISFIATDCNIHDSIIVKKLIDNIFIDKDVFSTHCHTFLADSAYSGFTTIDYITSIGLKLIIGRNNQHVKKIINIHTANDYDKKHYKKRGIVENFFGNLLRIPCLLNNYEKTIESYMGLAILYMSSNLAKKINKIIVAKNNIKMHSEHLIDLDKKNMLQKERKKAYYERKIKRREKTIKESINRKKEATEKMELIKNKIWVNVNKKRLKRRYIMFSKKNAMNNDNQQKRRQKVLSYTRYEKYMKDRICRYVKDNILTSTYNYTFGCKVLHFIKAGAFTFTDNNIISMMQKLTKKDDDIIGQFAKDFFN